jgi:hypothetical protein
MSGLHAIRELRVCNDVTTEFLEQPVRLHEDRVLDCILPRSLVWLAANDAFAVACVCKAWNVASGVRCEDFVMVHVLICVNRCRQTIQHFGKSCC